MPEPQSTELNPEIRHIVDVARAVWIRRLIDHSRANSLLFYRDLKVGTLDLTVETDAVDRLLAGDKLPVESLATVPELRGCHTQAKSLDRLMKRIREAIELCLEVAGEEVKSSEFVGVQWITVNL